METSRWSTHRFTGEWRTLTSVILMTTHRCSRQPACFFPVFVGINTPKHQRWTRLSLTCLRQLKKLPVRPPVVFDTTFLTNKAPAAPGYLWIQTWPVNMSSLSPFENLEIIRGRTKRYVPGNDPPVDSTGSAGSQWLFYLFVCHRPAGSGSRSVVVTQLEINHLGLRSLKEISDGDVVIIKNSKLCYTNERHWKRFFKSQSQSAFVEDNANVTACGK